MVYSPRKGVSEGCWSLEKKKSACVPSWKKLHNYPSDSVWLVCRGSPGPRTQRRSGAWLSAHSCLSHSHLEPLGVASGILVLGWSPVFNQNSDKPKEDASINVAGRVPSLLSPASGFQSPGPLWFLSKERSCAHYDRQPRGEAGCCEALGHTWGSTISLTEEAENGEIEGPVPTLLDHSLKTHSLGTSCCELDQTTPGQSVTLHHPESIPRPSPLGKQWEWWFTILESASTAPKFPHCFNILWSWSFFNYYSDER